MNGFDAFYAFQICAIFSLLHLPKLVKVTIYNVLFFKKFCAYQILTTNKHIVQMYNNLHCKVLSRSPGGSQMPQSEWPDPGSH